MSANSAPQAPFRADHVGSLLRPAPLHEARARFAAGEIDRTALRAAEDAAVRDVVALQEGAGLQSVTDGEVRRTIWHTDFLTGFDGIENTKTDYTVAFRGENGETAGTGSMMVVTGPVRRTRPVMVDHFAYLKSVTSRTAKFCIPSPTYLHMRGGRRTVSEAVYPDIGEFWADIVAAYRAEIADLAAAGCTYLQLDDVSFSCLCDETIRGQIRCDGLDPDALSGRYAEIINAIIADRPPGMSITMHTCRGNFQSMWMATGGYEAVAEQAFGHAKVDGLFLEFDSDRAGGFEPLRFVRPGTKVVLGLVSSKTATVEGMDDLRRRIDQAAKYIELDRLCLSPQCGFASSHHGNRLGEDIERRKLELIVRTAEAVWGTSA